MPAPMTSRLPGFHALPFSERRRIITRIAKLDEDDLRALDGVAAADVEALVENVVGVTTIPIGLATNFVVDGKEVLVPMAVEESSVVAAASNGARIARKHGGFRTEADPPVMVGQIVLVDVPGDPRDAARRLQTECEEYLEPARDALAGIAKRGGGVRGVETRILETKEGTAIVVHLLIDVRDAMGANAVNTACEAASPLAAKLVGGRALLRILSNLADKRIVRAEAVFDKDALGGPRVVRDVVRAAAIAAADPHRAATNNKGIMNGIDGVVVATGNDWRAAEAGAHAWAARKGRYSTLTTYEVLPDGNLRGRIELPLAVGTVGGATRAHPTARAALKVLGNPGAQDLARIAASVGLAQNLAALRALVDEGIQSGHMRLHAVNLALQAGADQDKAALVAKQMVDEGHITATRAREILARSP